MGAQGNITITGVATDGKFNSADQVSGTPGKYTINGSGFGTKTTGTPYFDNFETYTAGAVNSGLIGSLGQANYGGTSIDTVVKHTGTKSVKHDFNLVRFPQLGMDYASPQRTAYMSCRYRFTGTTTGASSVWKFGRFGNDVSYQPNRFSDEYTAGLNATAPAAFSGSIYTQDGGYIAYSALNEVAEGAARFTPDTFHFYEIEQDAGTYGVTSGFVEVRVDGVATVRFTGYPLADTTHTDLIKWMLTPITGLDDADTINIQAWIDELYHDQSRCRVVMTDNANYSLSTKWSLQLLGVGSSWANTQIIVNKNRGELTVGSTAYLHVFDSAGTKVLTTSGFLVTEDNE